jgi:peptidoglycan hydrolase-like protein with peptidoglycan-binding domain
MRMWLTMLLVSVLWLCPVMTEAGTGGGSGTGQQNLITKDNLKLLQERLQAEGVYAGPVDGEMNAQTEAALRQYQQKQGLPVSGTVDEETLRQLQLRLPTSPQGTGR